MSSFLQNNIALVIAAVASGILLLWPLISRRGSKEVDTLVAVQLINYKDAMVLDLREGSEYDAGHIPNSKHIPADKLEQRVQELEKFKGNPVLLIHRSSAHSIGKAGAFLKSQGFPHVHDIAGGIDAWKQAGLPVVKK